MTLEKNSTAFRLSPQQRLGWLTDMPAPSLELHHHGKLDLEWLRHALTTAVKHHESLRLRLQSSAGFQVPLQIIANGIAAEKQIHINSERNHFANTEFNQISVSVAEIKTDVYRINITLPLLSADRGTIKRFAESLCISQAISQQEDMTYTQYSAWLYELQSDEDANDGHDYWEKNSIASTRDTDILYKEEKKQHEAVSSMPSEAIKTTPEFFNALNIFCDHNGYTPETVLITAWASLLQRLSTGVNSEASAIDVHWVHDCRNDYEELSRCWGLFSKALPLHWAHSLEGSFTDAIAHASELQDAATEWQEYYAIESEPVASRYGFEYGDDVGKKWKTSLGQFIELIAVNTCTQPFELLLVPELIENQQVYRFSMHYDPRCYSAQAIKILLEQYQSLVMSAIQSPTTPLKNHTLYSETFTQHVKISALRSEIMSPASADLFPHEFSQRAAHYKDDVALYGQNQRGHFERLTYAELDAKTNHVAHYLRSLGVGAETRVAIYLDRTTDLMISLVGVLKSGAAFLPLETQQPVARIQAILAAAAPALIISSNTLTPPAAENIPCISIENINNIECVNTPLNVAIQPEHAAYILFTSGSTGTPKGVIIEHAQLHNYVNSICARINLLPATKSALVTSLAADLSYTLLFPALLTGGELHIVNRTTVMDPDAWAEYQSQHKIEHIKAVPSLVDAWLNHPNPKTVLPHTHLILGGETCATSLLNKIRGAAPNLTLYNHYGPTETTVGVLMHKADPTVVYRQLPLSEPLDHIHIYLLNDQQQVSEPGQAAELYIGGPQLARGYLHEEQTRERFTTFNNQRVYRTGDLARYRHDGALEIIGRADRQIKIRGFRIELDEVQVLLSQFPDIRQAAVEAIPNVQGELKMFAFVSLKTESQITVLQLQNQLQTRLPDYMLPAVRVVEQLPLMANGKLDRQTLREWANKMTTHVSLAPPRTPLEELLVELWAEVLGLEKVGIHDDFFKIGGHSLAAVKLASRIQRALTTDISVNAIFSAATVADFAGLIQQGTLFSPLVDLSVHEASQAAHTRPNLFCLPSSNGHTHDYRVLAEQLSSWQVWGLQASYLINADFNSAAKSIDLLAAHYVAQIREQQAVGPYHLIGWSLGGLLAVTIAAKLESAGERINFLGVVDTQMCLDEIAENVESLIETTTAELDADSQLKMRNLPEEKRKALFELLADVEKEQWAPTLGQWAQQQGMNLHDDNWDMRLNLHLYIQTLIRSFRAPRLDCEIHTWWASDTITAYNGIPLDWNAMTGSNIKANSIQANHLTILKQKLFHEQLRDRLTHTSSDINTSHSAHYSSAAMTEEIV